MTQTLDLDPPQTLSQLCVCIQVRPWPPLDLHWLLRPQWPLGAPGCPPPLLTLPPGSPAPFLVMWVSTPDHLFFSSLSAEGPPPATPMEVQDPSPVQVPTQNLVQPSQTPVPVHSPDLDSAQQLDSSPKDGSDGSSDSSAAPATDPSPAPDSVPDPAPSTAPGPLQEGEPSQQKELEEGQEIYIQTEGLTVQMAEPGLDRIVIVNGPDGTTMHIQTPEGVPLEAVQALLGIETADEAKAPQ